MSLLRIALTDFVIVDHLDLDLDTGFTALTGETGAGKSILIDALQLALGGRADASVVREGRPRAEVAAEFAASPAVIDWLQQLDMEPPGATLLLRRTVDTQGRSKGWINGTPATATQLRELGGMLVDIHGQHAWHHLTQADTARALLDGYGRIDSGALLPLWSAWKKAEAALAQAQADAAQAQAQREALLWQTGELEQLAPLPLEWPQLHEEYTRLANVQALLDAGHQASQWVSEADDSALSRLTRALHTLEQRRSLDPRLASITQTLEQTLVLTNEAARDLQLYLRHTESDPEQLARLEQRITTWLSLAKRHHCTPPELPDMLARSRHRLAQLDSALDTESLEKHSQDCYGIFKEKCEEISANRLMHKDKLATHITQLMQKLGMQGGSFDIHLAGLEKPQSTGAESVEFLVAGHAGTTPKPIVKVASGGELSRIALAIAVSTSEVNGCPTLIFDEVDSGVGGTVAHAVGSLMAQLGQHRQVLAVTHLPQVAACANHHLGVSKVRVDNGVVSQVRSLTPAEREQEIARMLGGASVTDVALAHAKELLT